MTAAATRAPRLPRGAVVAVGVLVAALVAGLAGGQPHREGPPLDPRSDGPLGASALVTLLRRLDAEVSLAVGLPGATDDVALLLQDQLDPDQQDEVRAWVRSGGTLVVTDPGSPFAPQPVVPGGLPSDESLDRGLCTIDALDDVEVVDGGQAIRYDTVGTDATCFERDGEAYITLAEVGLGEVVSIGGAAVFTNDLLDESDNAVLAGALLAPVPGSTVRVVDAPLPAGGGEKSLGDLVPGGLRRALVQLGIAFVLYAAWRALRLGKPVPETLPVPLAGSELVSATGRLLGRTGSASAAAETLRSELRRRLRARLGVDPHADTTLLASIAAARTGRSEDEVLAAIDHRPVATDAELVAVARAVSSINQEVPR